MTAQIWINDRGAIPAWVALFVSEGRQPNGTFLIKTPLGNARVHVGNAVFMLGSRAYTCPAGEIRQYVRMLDDATAPPPPKDFGRNIGVLAADVAPRADVTDDITRRIRLQKLGRLNWFTAAGGGR